MKYQEVPVEAVDGAESFGSRRRVSSDYVIADYASAFEVRLAELAQARLGAELLLADLSWQYVLEERFGLEAPGAHVGALRRAAGAPGPGWPAARRRHLEVRPNETRTAFERRVLGSGSHAGADTLTSLVGLA